VARYLETPKKFDRIAAAFDNKTTAECVQFYYLNKGALQVRRHWRTGGRTCRPRAHEAMSTISS
jgi:hypothetical protein